LVIHNVDRIFNSTTLSNVKVFIIGGNLICSMWIAYKWMWFIETTDTCVYNGINQLKQITAFGYVDHSNPMDEMSVVNSSEIKLN